MSLSPDSEFAKIFELLNAFEQLDENGQPPPLQSAVPAKVHPLKQDAFAQPSIAPDHEAENTFAAHIAAAMAKRTRP